jgi:hypothetical protein
MLSFLTFVDGNRGLGKRNSVRCTLARGIMGTANYYGYA